MRLRSGPFVAAWPVRGASGRHHAIQKRCGNFRQPRNLSGPNSIAAVRDLGALEDVMLAQALLSGATARPRNSNTLQGKTEKLNQVENNSGERQRLGWEDTHKFHIVFVCSANNDEDAKSKGTLAKKILDSCGIATYFTKANANIANSTWIRHEIAEPSLTSLEKFESRLFETVTDSRRTRYIGVRCTNEGIPHATIREVHDTQSGVLATLEHATWDWSARKLTPALKPEAGKLYPENEAALQLTLPKSTSMTKYLQLWKHIGRHLEGRITDGTSRFSSTLEATKSKRPPTETSFLYSGAKMTIRVPMEAASHIQRISKHHSFKWRRKWLAGRPAIKTHPAPAPDRWLQTIKAWKTQERKHKLRLRIANIGGPLSLYVLCGNIRISLAHYVCRRMHAMLERILSRRQTSPWSEVPTPAQSTSWETQIDYKLSGFKNRIMDSRDPFDVPCFVAYKCRGRRRPRLVNAWCSLRALTLKEKWEFVEAVWNMAGVYDVKPAKMQGSKKRSAKQSTRKVAKMSQQKT